MLEEWRSVRTIPKDGSVIEVLASPHGVILAYWDSQHPPYSGVWRFADKEGGYLMVPIYPTKWRPHGKQHQHSA
jgi:hypothetical protein